jgi:hypothetical protein
MKLKTTLVVNTSSEHAYFDYLRMKMVDEGLVVEGKSPLFAAWMKTLYEPTPTFQAMRTSHPWYVGPKTYYRLAKEFPPRGLVQSPGWIYPDEFQFFSDSRPNLMWLLHKDLGTGFSITVKQPISLNNFQDYFSECCEAVRDIYTGMLRQASAEATFSEIWPEVEA